MIVNVLDIPGQFVPPVPFTGVTVIVPLPAFAVKEGILKLLDKSAVPLAPRPIPVLEFVHVKDVASVPVKTIGIVIVPLQ